MLKESARSFWREFWLEEDGQGTVEYLLILSAVVVSAVAISRTIIKTLDQGMLKLGGQLEKDLKTGRAPLYVWDS